jgi:hypothetical protein
MPPAAHALQSDSAMLVSERKHPTGFALQAILASEAALVVLVAVTQPTSKVAYVAAGVLLGQLVALLSLPPARRS